jgi:hypothetical protein
LKQVFFVSVKTRSPKRKNKMPNLPFDRKLKIWNDRIPPEIQEASIMVYDTLELAWASAQQIFGEHATPEIAVDIFDLIQSQSRRRRRHTEES